MKRIIELKDVQALVENLKFSGMRIVLVGGCFDILHAGHIDFLKKARDLGDALIVMLESDEKIKKLKGSMRPINNQSSRAIILSNLPVIDYVVSLKNLENDSDYEALVKIIQPDIIAITSSDRVFDWEKKYKIQVIKRENTKSTTKIIEELNL